MVPAVRQVGVEVGHHLGVLDQEVLVVEQGPPVDGALEHGDRVAVAGPGGRVDPVEQDLGPGVPAPPQVVGEPAQALELGRQTETARRATSGRGRGDPCAPNDRRAQRAGRAAQAARVAHNRPDARRFDRRRVRTVGQGRRPGRRGRCAGPQPGPDGRPRRPGRRLPAVYRSVWLPADLPVEELQLVVPGPYGPATSRQPGGAARSSSARSRPTATGSAWSTFPPRSIATGSTATTMIPGASACSPGQPSRRSGSRPGRSTCSTSTIGMPRRALVLRDRFYAVRSDRRPWPAGVAPHDPQPRLSRLGGPSRPGQRSGWPPAIRSSRPDAAGIDLLWAGIERADLVNTVSPTFAAEALTPAVGFGLDPTLRWKAGQHGPRRRSALLRDPQRDRPGGLGPSHGRRPGRALSTGPTGGQGGLPGRPPRSGRLRPGRPRPGPRDDRPARSPERLRPAGRGGPAPARRRRPARSSRAAATRLSPSPSGHSPGADPTGSS